MVAAIHTEQKPFGEAPWLIPLLEQARIMLDVKELGGDKAYDSNNIYRYLRSTASRRKSRSAARPSRAIVRTGKSIARPT